MRADVVVVGGGPAGCAAALGVARAGGKVVLLERGASRKPGEIVEAMIRLPLSELGLLASFEALNSLLLAGSRSIWDSDASVGFDGIKNPYGHGALIDRHEFERWFINAVSNAGVHVAGAARDVTAEADNGGWRIRGTSNGRVLDITAPVVIEATGRGRGPISRGDRDVTDRLAAFLTYGSTPPGPQDQRLIIEASRNGWWYAAPLPGNNAVIAFMTDVDLAPRSMAHRTQYLKQELAATKIVREFAERLHDPGRMFGFPANSSLKRVINGRNWVAIGDAAATYDPLSGRGVAVALAKGTAIARLLTRCSDLSQALEAYADTERATFSDYLIEQRSTYSRGAERFRSPFWDRRSGGVS